MNKIVLLHTPNTFNYGSAMMGITFIHRFSSIVNNDFIYATHLFSEDDLKRLENETLNKYSIKKLEINSSLNIRNKKEKAINFIRKIIHFDKYILSLNPIGIVVLGGDDISEYYSIIGLIGELYLIYKLSKESNVFLLGQTIGPFYSWRKKIARFCLSNCQIFTRDPLSANYLKNELNLKNVFESSDLAFLDLPRQNDLDNAKKLFEKYSITPNNYITIIPSGLVNHYTSNYIDYINTWIKIITQLSKLPSLKSKKIVLLTHVLRVNFDDRKIIDEIRKELPDEISNHMVYITDVLLPSEARIILGNGVFTITGRMHGAISTFQMLKPAISLSYSVKYKGVIGENLGMPDLIIEAKSDVLWSSGNLVELVMNKVDYVLMNYDEIISRIDIGVEKNKKLAMTQIEYVAKKLEELMK